VGDVKILCPMGGRQWQVMHFIHVSEGIEVKKLLSPSNRTLLFLDNICHPLYFRQHIRGFHNIILQNPTYFFSSAPLQHQLNQFSHPEVVCPKC
jgi:hypothetical protein